jgi:hypothetical protein
MKYPPTHPPTQNLPTYLPTLFLLIVQMIFITTYPLDLNTSGNLCLPLSLDGVEYGEGLWKTELFSQNLQ